MDLRTELEQMKRDGFSQADLIAYALGAALGAAINDARKDPAAAPVESVTK